MSEGEHSQQTMALGQIQPSGSFCMTHKLGFSFFLFIFKGFSEIEKEKKYMTLRLLDDYVLIGLSSAAWTLDPKLTNVLRFPKALYTGIYNCIFLSFSPQNPLKM